MYLIVGLGNPGLLYRNTRHNAGFCAVDALAKDVGLRFAKKKFNAQMAEGKIGPERVVLLKPQTFMNRSGESVREAVQFYKLPLDRLIVVYDDVDLPLGTVRIKAQGSAGTHNGMRSVIGSLGSQDFVRVRIGVGKNPAQMQLAAYVLSKPGRAEKKVFIEACGFAAEAASEIVTHGVTHAQSRYNRSVEDRL